jgi:hypothetical protein
MLRLVDSTYLTEEEIAPHLGSIMVCLEKYCARFPKEETPQNMLASVIKGDRRMWLVMDENDQVVLVPITSIETLNANGRSQLFLAECAGSRLKEAMPLLAEIERWAKETHGVWRARFVARKGWTDYLEPLGYKAKAIVFDKEL